MLIPVGLLALSNLFMTYAWYGHLKTLKDQPLWIAILVSWGIAFFEYCLQVPANRYGYQSLSLGQLKVLQEVISLLVFAGFAFWYMEVPLTRNYLYAGFCLIGAVYFIFAEA